MLTANCVVDMGNDNLEMSIDDQKATSNIFEAIKCPGEDRRCFKVEEVNKEDVCILQTTQTSLDKALINVVGCLPNEKEKDLRSCLEDLDHEGNIPTEGTSCEELKSRNPSEKTKMASRKRRAIPTQGGDSTWIPLALEIAWHKYQDNVHLRNTLSERNVELSASTFDEFYGELQRRLWHQVLTKLLEKPIDVALVKELYSNIYDPEDDTPKYYDPPPVVRHQSPSTSILIDQHRQMLQSIYQGQQIIVHGLYRLSIHLGMDTPLTTPEAFIQQVAWPGG
ncbi:hypothetical protein HKD37_14G040992 [Glycine soja]